MVANARKLLASGWRQPGDTGGQLPSSKVAEGSKASSRLSMQPPWMHVPSSTTAKSR
jgi:hypothetical protein